MTHSELASEIVPPVSRLAEIYDFGRNATLETDPHAEPDLAHLEGLAAVARASREDLLAEMHYQGVHFSSRIGSA